MSIDSLRADHCGYWGYHRDTTPVLDGMAEQGIVFENAIAPGPKTPESMPAVFTGEFPAVELNSTGIDSWQEQVRPHMQARETIAEQFSRQGYTTGAFTPNGFTSEYFGFDAGFDQFEDFLDEDYRPGFEMPNIVRGLIKWVRREGNWKFWEEYYDRIIRFVRNSSEPFFLWVFLLDVHSPYLVPGEYRTENSWPEMIYANWKREDLLSSDPVKRRLISAYDDTIRYADEFLRRIKEDLDGTDPAIVVHSDHGEAFGEHGIQGHERYLFEENLHVPFLIDNVGCSGNIDKPVSIQSVPSVLDLVANDKTDDLLTRLRSRTVADSPIAFRSNEGNGFGLRIDQLKWIYKGDDFSLYDLESDPTESTDVSEEHPNLCEHFYDLMRIYLSSNREKRTVVQQASELVSGAVDRETVI